MEQATPETTHIEVTADVPDSYTINVHKAALMAHAENDMRRSAVGADAEYQLARIEGRTKEVSDAYDDIQESVKKATGHAYDSIGAYPESQRTEMKAHLDLSLAKIGLTGEVSFDPDRARYDLPRDPDFKQASGHADRSNDGQH